MTIEYKADEYASESGYAFGSPNFWITRQAYIAGAAEATKELQAENKALQELIKKMKCCENCIHHRFWGDELGCNLDFDKQFECDNNCHKYWELSE